MGEALCSCLLHFTHSLFHFRAEYQLPLPGGVALVISHNQSYAKLECEISIHLC